MIQVAVVEDEAVCREQLGTYLKKFEQEQDETIEVAMFSDGDQILKDYRPVYDIIFLDIQMKFVDGMKAAEEIRKLDSKVMLIFVTNMAQYAIRGYEVNAFDFILKPLSYFAFSQKLKRAVVAVKKQAARYLSVKIDGGLLRLSLKEIEYIESMKHRIMLHTSTETYSFTGTMKEMEERLLEDHFFRCNNSYLVNLSKVKRVNGSEVLVGEHLLQISRPRRKAFLAALTDHMGGM